MILLEINADRVAGFELESDAPRTVDVNRIARGDEASQGMKIEPGEVHFLRRSGNVQWVQRIMMRLCSLASTLAERPFDHRSASALLRNVLITRRNVS